MKSSMSVNLCFLCMVIWLDSRDIFAQTTVSEEYRHLFELEFEAPSWAAGQSSGFIFSYVPNHMLALFQNRFTGNIYGVTDGELVADTMLDPLSAPLYHLDGYWMFRRTMEPGFPSGLVRVNSDWEIVAGASRQRFEGPYQPRLFAFERHIYVVTGDPYDASADQRLHRFDLDGSKDDDFANLSTISNFQWVNVVSAPSGGILVYLVERETYGLRLTRRRENGTLDTTYGRFGNVYLNPDVLMDRSTIGVSAMQDDGAWYLAGFNRDDLRTGGRILKVSKDGAIDRQFGDNGIVDLPGLPTAWVPPFAQTVRANSRQLVVVEVGGTGRFRYRLICIDAQGQFCADFGEGGVVPLSERSSAPYSQPDLLTFPSERFKIYRVLLEGQ